MCSAGGYMHCSAGYIAGAAGVSASALCLSGACIACYYARQNKKRGADNKLLLFPIYIIYVIASKPDTAASMLIDGMLMPVRAPLSQSNERLYFPDLPTAE